MYNKKLNISDFIELVTSQFVSKTGVGIYVFLSPIEIHKIYNNYINSNVNIIEFTKDIIKNNTN